MTLTLRKRFKLFFVYVAIYALWFIDVVGALPEKVLSALFRLSLFFGFVFFLLTSVVIETANTEVLSLSTVPITSAVLGASKEDSVEYPVFVHDLPIPDTSFISALVYDVNNSKILFEHNKDLALPPASTTKLMTALVALDLYSLDEVLTVPYECTEIESSKGGYYWNEQVFVEELIRSLLIMSSGDSACILATGKESGENFVVHMNDYADAFGMVNTNFTNSIGLDSEFGDHLSSAYDLLLLGKNSMRNELIKDIVQVREQTLESVSGVERTFVNTNDLLWTVTGTTGVKTGTTEGAGEVLIYSYESGSKSLIIVVMGSMDRFVDTYKLLTWTLDSYLWEDDTF
jgi:serine-type D-Ala-D-Ala carboxypeptidase (penicillin-binding protein 5/6)